MIARMSPRRVSKVSAGAGLEGRLGAVLVLGIVLCSVFGSLVAPHPPGATLGPPGAAPSGQFLLGTDVAGRDVLSQLLVGGRTVLVLTLASTTLSYAFGITIGLLAGYRRSIFDSLLMRPMDLFIALPPILLVLLVIAGLGSSPLILVCAVAFVQMPFIARLVRTAALEVSVRGYVEMAIARGESRLWLFGREFLPNIIGPVIADFGLRFAYAVVLLASLNFLGLGLPAGTADWGLMVSENREIVSANPWAVFAPAVALACLTVGVNLLGQAFTRRFVDRRA